jgi:hypothetical protein
LIILNGVYVFVGKAIEIGQGVIGMKGLWLRTSILVLSLSSVAFGQVTWDFLGGGARAQGMGKAFYAISDDITAVTWNPAGLAKQEKPILGFTKAAFVPRGSFQDLGQHGLVDKSVNGRYEQNQSFNSFSFIGFLAPLRIRGHQFVLSAAYNRAFDEYLTTSYYDTGEVSTVVSTGSGPIDTVFTPAEISQATDADIAPYTFSIGFGTRFYKSWDLGVALNVYTGRSISHYNARSLAPNYYPINLLGQPVVYDGITRITDTTKYGGFNLVIGTKYASPQFDLGFVIKTAFSLRQKSNLVNEFVTYYNGLPTFALTTFNDFPLSKVKVPFTFAGGIVYRFSPIWSGSFDAEYRPWSGKKVLDRYAIIIRSGRSNQEFYNTIDPRWFNSIALRAGTEYMLATGGAVIPKVPLRAGVGFLKLPGPSYELPSGSNSGTITQADWGTFSKSMLTLSAGSGIYWEQVHLDAAYSYSGYGQDFPYGQMKNKNHSFSLTFTGYF